MAEHGTTNPGTRAPRSTRRSLAAHAAGGATAQPTTSLHTLPLASPPNSPCDIPDKLFFRIGEVARLCGVQTSVLRFWESAFPQLRPGKGGTGQRRFRRRDVETALRIRHLLYTDGYTIAGARQLLRNYPSPGKDSSPISPADPQSPSLLPFPTHTPTDPQTPLRELRDQLRELHILLSLHPQPARRSPASPPAPSTASLFEP